MPEAISMEFTKMLCLLFVDIIADEVQNPLW